MNGRGLAASPVTGHVYVTNYEGARISEFTAWGEFVRSFGWGVADGDPELQTCSSSCLAGLAGSGPGQLASPSGVAIDSTGNVYIADAANHRVQKFSPAGDWLLMFGGGVNVTTGDDVCTKADVEGGDECGAGSVGTATGEFGNWPLGDFIAVGPGDAVYVGDQGRIQAFEPTGAFKEALPLPGESSQGLDLDPAGNVYVVLAGKDDVRKLDPAGTQLATFAVDNPLAVAVDPTGVVYAISDPTHFGDPELEPRVLQFAADGSCLVCPGEDGENGFDRSKDGTSLNGLTTNSACGATDLYVTHFSNPSAGNRSYVRFFGPAPDPGVCPPPVVPPSIVAQYALSADTDSAIVRAEINPRYWAGATYYVQWGTADCKTSPAGCSDQPAPPGLSLGDQVVNAPVKTESIVLEGLQPNTTYYFRFVAESSAGGPVFGRGGKPGEDGETSTFTTPATPEENVQCGNQPFRFGFSAALPDCRAYELVSPVDKANGDVFFLESVTGFPAAINQSAPSGEKLTYSSYRAFGDPASAPYISQYIAARGPGGWSSEPISPPRGAPILPPGQTTDLEFKAFLPDLCGGWLRHDSDPPLDPTATAGFPHLFQGDYCGGRAYEALSSTPPSGRDGATFNQDLQGFSNDGGHAIFVANDNLTPDAPALDEPMEQLYESYRDGSGNRALRFVCVLPDGTPHPDQCSAGSINPEGEGLGRSSSVDNAISDDGSRIFWSAEGGSAARIYLRIDGQETIPVSAAAEALSKSAVAQFWTATPEGSRVLFSVESDLYEFVVATKKTTRISRRVKGVIGASDDISRVYFVSEDSLATGAPEEEPNLYLHERGEDVRFIATLSDDDAQMGTNSMRPTPVHREPVKRTSRVTPDGRHVVFMSTASIGSSPYDNTDASSSEPDAEVYLYSVSDEQLRCVSCNRTGARPTGKELVIAGKKTRLWAAAQIPGWENQLYAARVLSDDGNRIFFESFEALAPGDTNGGRQDVYQWERPGSGDCDSGDAAFVARAGGCVSLISSGKDSSDSKFLDASPSGSDVFFATSESLLPQDYGAIDIYDARVLGGFPQSPPPPAPCEGIACQNPPAAPLPLVPGSTAAHGPETRPKCPKGKRHVVRKGKPRCVKRHPKKQRSKQRGKRRAGR